MATLAGMTGWISDIASPALARFGGSYIAGGFIGWAFRRFVKFVLVTGAFTIASMALIKNVSVGLPPTREHSNDTSRAISPPSSMKPKG